MADFDHATTILGPIRKHLANSQGHSACKGLKIVAKVESLMMDTFPAVEHPGWLLFSLQRKDMAIWAVKI